MAVRTPRPFSRTRRSVVYWYVQLGKRQIPLGKDKDAAFKKYHGIMAGYTPIEGDDATVAQVICQFLTWNKANRSPSTHASYHRTLSSFATFIGEQLRVADLKVNHVTRWLDGEHPKIGDTTRHYEIVRVQRPLNWAVRQGLIVKNPIAYMEKPAATPRESYLDPLQWYRVMLYFNSDTRRKRLGEMLQFMRWTGCRPYEARTAEAKHYDRQLHALVFERRNSKGKRDRRLIPLTQNAEAMIQRLAEKHPHGPLFRNSRRNGWTKDAINCAMNRAKELLGIDVHAYAIRHTWATDALTNGVDPITVANIMGHKSLRMLHENYGHVMKRPDHLRSALDKALGQAG